jgi:two-component system chemotaxis sensor kinase CheA
MSSDGPESRRHSCGLEDAEEVQAKSRMKYLFNLHGLEENTVENMAAAEGRNRFHINVELEPNLKVKTARVFVIVKNLEKSGKISSIVPSLDAILARKFENSFEFDFQTDATLEDVTRLVKNAGDIAKATVQPLS